MLLIGAMVAEYTCPCGRKMVDLARIWMPTSLLINENAQSKIYRSFLGLDKMQDKSYTTYMITKWKSRQDWSIGQTVKVGFMTLRVLGVRAVKDCLPDIYDLESLDGSKKYEFIPHNGLSRIN